MAEGGISVLDGTQLRSLHVSIPDTATTITGAHLLELAGSGASQSLLGLSLPQTLKSSALSRLQLESNEAAFRETELTSEEALRTLNDYIAALADELHDNPIAVSVLDGTGLLMFLEDEDDFAMIAESLFTDLDTEDKGKISKKEVKNALIHMGVQMGVPPIEDFPVLNDILKKHGVEVEGEGEGELGQSQFAELLLPILQEAAEALAENPIAVILKINIVNGSIVRKLLSDESQLNDVMGKILQEKHGRNNNQKPKEVIRDFLEKKGKNLGLPPSEANEAVVLLYDTIFADVEDMQGVSEEDDQFRELVKQILVKFAEQLEANPVYCDVDN